MRVSSFDPPSLQLIQTFSKRKGTLIFCVTKRGAELACTTLLQSGIELVSPTSQQVLAEVAAKIADKNLASFILRGAAVHHSALQPHVRQTIEDLFIAEHIKVVCCTTTLAQGVNLPAHLVVVKSTLGYKNGAYQEYDALEMLQMIGRAGRPRYDSEGVAVILTDKQEEEKWRQITTGNVQIESQLEPTLVEYLNAEVFLGTVSTILEALQWLKLTFFYVRAKKNRDRYKLDTSSESNLLHFLSSRLEELQTLGLVEIAQNRILSTPLGAAMAKHGVAFKTMQGIVKAKRSLYTCVDPSCTNQGNWLSSLLLRRPTTPSFERYCWSTRVRAVFASYAREEAPS
eukprot:GHVN01020210.1.p1 GENE.GHVN01020210.1~~GHVN01020210.1.p1  ORF type:complete len:343 (-),score=35.34 GHVN01020210.1:2536-3564(-)